MTLRMKINRETFLRGLSMTGTRYNEMAATKLPVDPYSPVAAMEQADRQSLHRQPAFC